jgi:nitroreductase
LVEEDQKPMTALPQQAIAQLFTEARSHSAWTDKKVDDATIHQLFDLVKWGPTSANSIPARFLFLRGEEKKRRLVPLMAEGNREKTEKAPLTVVVAMDPNFLEHMPRLFPFADFKAMLAGKPEVVQHLAMQGSSLQGGYLIMAARTLGLDAGPMNGFDGPGINAEFFKDSGWKVNFVCNLGYADHSKVLPRLPRLSFDEAAKIIG